MQTILVPIDFSDASRSASLYAATLAKATGAKLLLFHSYMIPTPVSEVPYVMVSVDEIQAENEKFIRKEAVTIHANFGVEVETLLQIGMPSDEITILAEEKNVALTIIGMRGAGGIDKLIGSTTATVVRKSKTPVLVVPHDFVFRNISRIVYASDFSYASSTTLFAPLIEIGRAYHSNLSVIHVQKAPGTTISKEEQQSKADITTTLAELNPEFTVINDESISHGIKSYTGEKNADLLVMVSHRHNFFDRLFSKIHTTEMAYETRIPLLVLPDNRR
ncbi:MAG: universal stress protein [Chitinophagaceae bacterium]|nr:MAG: universal stress protein [Chitinophagaceae bacterium]